MTVPGTPAAPPAPPRIAAMPAILANQIAAGEVVERPASVLKELVENSLDAGATRVEVEAAQGGVRLLRVRDDGWGIHRDDLALALTSHATSKITALEDLEGVRTLGFRGEALPSIAAVSRMVLRSRSGEEAHGWEVRVDGGRPEGPPRPVAMPPGTVVEVADLFHRIPARRKFLRTPRTELQHVQEALRRLALSRWGSAFRLLHEGRELLAAGAVAGGQGPAERLLALLGRGFMEQAFPLTAAAGELTLQGWVAGRAYSRPQPDLQYLYLNGRMVRDRVVARAVREAYAEAIPQGRHPAWVLYLEMAPGTVDVNVHPTKHEVRFREIRLVHDFVRQAVSRALEAPGEQPWAAAPEPVPEPGPEPAEPAPFPAPGAGGGAAARPAGGAGAAPPAGARGTPSPLRIREQLAGYGALLGPGRGSGALRRARPGDRAEFSTARGLTVIGERFGVLQDGDALVLVDLNCARATLARNRLAAALAAPPAPSRPLLVPVTVPLQPADGPWLDAMADLLERLGVDLVASGPERATLHRLPVALGEVDPVALAGRLPEALRACAELPVDGSWPDAVARRLGAILPPGPTPSPGELGTLLARLEAMADAPATPCVRRLDGAALAGLCGR